MNPRFYVNSFRNLMVEVDRESETIIAASFMQNENKAKAADYLKAIATELNEAYPRDQNKAHAILEEAKQKVRDAQLAEKCLEEVTF